MKLLNKEVDPRIVVKVNKSIKDDKSSGIMTYGANNDYPQIFEKLILGSQSASAVVETYAKFIGGASFSNKAIGAVIVGKDNKGKPITLDRMRRNIAKSMAMFHGAYVHCNKNIEGNVTSTRIIPFKNCRFSREDAEGFCARIAVSPEWDNMSNSAKKNITWFNVFSTNKDILLNNIKDAGGIEAFKGQVYFSFVDDYFLYPLSPMDSVELEMQTEYLVQVYKNREVTNGFSDKIVMYVQTGDDEAEQEAVNATIQSFMGPDGDKALVFGAEFDEAGNLRDRSFKLEKLESNIDDTKFGDAYGKTITNNIRKAAKNLPAVLIDYDAGGLGQMSGEAIIQATNFYNAVTSSVREQVAEMIKEIYSNFNNEILKTNTDWNIDQVEIITENETKI